MVRNIFPTSEILINADHHVEATLATRGTWRDWELTVVWGPPNMYAEMPPPTAHAWLDVRNGFLFSLSAYQRNLEAGPCNCRHSMLRTSLGGLPAQISCDQ